MILNKSANNQSLLSRRRLILSNKATEAEVYVKNLLEQINEPFCFQKGFFNESTHYIVDFYLKRRKRLCLEIDGGYHLNPRQIDYDRKRDSFLENARGFRVKRITNEKAFLLDEESILSLIS